MAERGGATLSHFDTLKILGRDPWVASPHSKIYQREKLNFWPYTQRQQRQGQRQRWVGDRCVAIRVPTLRV